MKQKVDEKIQACLPDATACYVLISCSEPAKDGSMQVDMTYEGNPALAAYLLQNAQSLVDEHIEEELQINEDFSQDQRANL